MIDLQEKTSTDENNRAIHESVDETIQKVIDFSHVCEAKVNDNNISITGRLPFRKPGECPFIFRFARRTGE